jgi:hypothetical protein
MNDEPADDQLEAAKREKCEIPAELSFTRVHVMHAQDLVIDDAFDHIEQPPAEEQRAHERSCGFYRNLAVAVLPFLLIGAVCLRAQNIGRGRP